MKLESEWSMVEKLPVHARVSTDATSSGSVPVVLVHGLGVASRSFAPVAEALSPHHPVYAPDLPGFGESGKPKRTLTIAELAKYLAAWTKANGLEGAAFFANSFGCQVIVELAVRRPEFVGAVILQGPTMDPEARTVRRLVPRWLKNSRNEPSGALRTALEDYRKCGLARLIRTFLHSLEDPIERKLPFVRVPALVVRGELDTIVPQSWAEEACRLLPKGELAVVPDGPHTLVYATPRELAKLVREFLNKTSE